MTCERLIFARPAIVDSGKPVNWQAVGRTLHPIHPVNLSLGHDSSIQEVSGRGNSRAFDTISHPRGRSRPRTLPLRAIRRKASQAVANSRVVRTSWATYRKTYFRCRSPPPQALRPRLQDARHAGPSAEPILPGEGDPGRNFARETFRLPGSRRSGTPGDAGCAISLDRT